MIVLFDAPVKVAFLVFIAHELAHVRRGDWPLQLTAEKVTVTFTVKAEGGTDRR